MFSLIYTVNKCFVSQLLNHETKQPLYVSVGGAVAFVHEELAKVTASFYSASFSVCNLIIYIKGSQTITTSKPPDSVNRIISLMWIAPRESLYQTEFRFLQGVSQSEPAPGVMGIACIPVAAMPPSSEHDFPYRPTRCFFSH